MLLDAQTMFSDHQALTTGNQLSTNVLQMRKTGQFSSGGNTITPRTPVYHNDWGKGEPVEIFAQVTTNFTGGTSTQVQVVMADDEAMTQNLTVLAETAAVPLAQLKAGYQFRLNFLPHGVTKDFLALRYVTVGTHTAGKVSAGLTLARQTSLPFA